MRGCRCWRGWRAGVSLVRDAGRHASVVTDARRVLAALGLAVAPVVTTNRSTLSVVPAAGLTPNEAEPHGKEILALWRFAEKELKHEKTRPDRRADETIAAAARTTAGR